jgi:hypothetical protein
VPGLVLFRWDAPLFFANAKLFRDRVLEAVAGSPTPVRWLVDKLKRFGLFSRLGAQRFFATLGEAVSCYLESASVAWVDWEDRVDGGAKDGARRSRTAESIDPSTQGIVADGDGLNVLHITLHAYSRS